MSNETLLTAAPNYHLKTRSWLTLAAVTINQLMAHTLATVSPLVSGPIAAQQLTDSNLAYIGTQAVAQTLNGNLPGYFLVGALFIIWFGAVAAFFENLVKGN